MKYASWMRELEFLEDEDDISRGVFDMLLWSPHPKPLCPRLLKLSWIADPVFWGDFTPFLSSQLQDVYLASRPGTLFMFPRAISALPISSLRSLRLSIIGDEPVREAIASILKASGKSLTNLKIFRMDQLQDGSWCHIISLPRLRSLETDQWPPIVFPPSLPEFFPSLQQIILHGPAAFRWVNFLAEGSAQRISSNTRSQSHKVAPRLVQLHCDYEADLDVTFISHFRAFRNLYTLVLGNGCSRATRRTFHLTDNDISQLAMELPELRELSLGDPCMHNTCRTTVNSLLTLSTHCKGLRKLRIHFNTRNFARDMRHSLHNPLRRNSHPPSRCPLVVLDVGPIPLTTKALGKDLFPTLAGLVDIFPGLQGISCTPSSHTSRGWRQLGAQIPSFQEMRKSLPAVFTQ